jgi:nitrogen fixation protein FixH
MNNRLILLGIMFMVSLFALPLTGCDTDSGMVLVVKVDTPKDGSTVNTPTVTVSGRVVGTESKGAKVSINNIDAPVTDGKYSANVTLKEGKNIINIVAKSGQAAPEETVTVTYKK